MNAVQLLTTVVSAEGAVLMAVLAWAARRLVRQLDLNTRLVDEISERLERHLAWHDGQDLSRTGARSGY